MQFNFNCMNMDNNINNKQNINNISSDAFSIEINWIELN